MLVLIRSTPSRLGLVNLHRDYTEINEGKPAYLAGLGITQIDISEHKGKAAEAGRAVSLGRVVTRPV
jgi:hypothetical protein